MHHRFTIFHKPDEESDVVVPIIEFEDACEACFESINMERRTGLKYTVVVTDGFKSKKVKQDGEYLDPC
jgi:hypothetical protein